MPKLIDLTGQRFGRLVVIERVGSDKQKRATWLCRCDCGREHVVASSYLINGDIKSCGCTKSELLIRRNTRHNKVHTKIYIVWANMVQRCTYPKHQAYHRYGGRGIAVCDEWRDSFQSFYDWAMAHGYDENAPKGQCTIDRIDNDKGYSPDNCRWVDMKTQRHNRSDSRKENRNERYQAN